MNLKILEKFKSAQNVAYQALQYTELHLEIGMTEIDACNLIKNYLSRRQVNRYFHHPFAWFGERTAFKNFRDPLSLPHLGKDFLPTQKKLEQGMCVILDVAPSIGGVVVDVGLSFSHGENSVVTKARRDLILFRNLILEGAKKNKLMSKIYFDCNDLLNDLGYENGHAAYPLGVLGHLVEEEQYSLFPKISPRGFQLNSYFSLMRKQVEKLQGILPNAGVWNENSHFELSVGLWAVEPHIVKGDEGVKFEEILVVTENDIYWLSDELPHVKMAV